MTIASLVGITLLGSLIGAVTFPSLIRVSMAVNYKGIATAYAGFPKDRGFYLAWACLGGTMGAVWAFAMTIMNAWEVKDPWYALVLIGSGSLLFWPMVRYLKARRSGGTPKT